MTRITPPLSECTLEDCGAYERFQVNKAQIWHRYHNDGNIIWVPAFENLDDFDKYVLSTFGNSHYWFSVKEGIWYTKSYSMLKGLQPVVETWYQDYLKSVVTTSDDYTVSKIVIGDVIVVGRTKEEKERVNKVMEERLNQLQSRPVTLNEPTKASRDS